MARRAGKHDGLAMMASALKREESKHARRSEKKHAVAAAKKEDSESESMHILEASIPRKKMQESLRTYSLTPRGFLMDYRK